MLKNKPITSQPVINVKCKQCHKILNVFEYLTSNAGYPICDKCVKKNHREACGIK